MVWQHLRGGVRLPIPLKWSGRMSASRRSAMSIRLHWFRAAPFARAGTNACSSSRWKRPPSGPAVWVSWNLRPFSSRKRNSVRSAAGVLGGGAAVLLDFVSRAGGRERERVQVRGGKERVLYLSRFGVITDRPSRAFDLFRGPWPPIGQRRRRFAREGAGHVPDRQGEEGSQRRVLHPDPVDGLSGPQRVRGRPLAWGTTYGFSRIYSCEQNPTPLFGLNPRPLGAAPRSPRNSSAGSDGRPTEGGKIFQG